MMTMNIKSMTQCQKLLGISKSHLTGIIRRYGIGTMKIGSVTMVDVDMVKAAMERDAEMITVQKVSEATGLTCRQVVRLIEDGTLEAERVGCTYRFESIEYVTQTLQERMGAHDTDRATGHDEGIQWPEWE